MFSFKKVAVCTLAISAVALGGHCPDFACSEEACNIRGTAAGKAGTACKWNADDSTCAGYDACSEFDAEMTCTAACATGCEWKDSKCATKDMSGVDMMNPSCDMYDGCETGCTAMASFGCTYADSKCGGTYAVPNMCQLTGNIMAGIAADATAKEAACTGVCGECTYDAEAAACVGTCPAPTLPPTPEMPAMTCATIGATETTCNTYCADGCSYADGACSGTFKMYEPTSAPAADGEEGSSASAASATVAIVSSVFALVWAM